MPREIISVSLAEETIKDAHSFADQNGMSFSRAVEHLLLAALWACDHDGADTKNLRSWKKEEKSGNKD